MNTELIKCGNIALWCTGSLVLGMMIRKAIHKRTNRHVSTVEICLGDIESFKNAINGGANSVELCVDRSSGGVTPSYGLVQECCARKDRSGSEVHVLIRPRDGNFNYTCDEYDLILDDIIAAKHAGADGVVVGVLTSDNKVDMTRMAIIRKISHPMMLTFHRAFDICASDLEETVLQVISLGCDRLLTSGRSSCAETGMETLKTIIQIRDNFIRGHAGSNHLRVIAAAGVSAENVGKIIMMTGVDGVHAGSSVVRRRHIFGDPGSTSHKSSSHSIGNSGEDRGAGIDGDYDSCDISEGDVANYSGNIVGAMTSGGVTDFDDMSISGVVCVDEVCRLVDAAEESWDIRVDS